MQIKTEGKGGFMINALKWLLAGILITAVHSGCMAETKYTLEVLNPRGRIDHSPYRAPNPRIPDLSGKKIALYWNGKAGGNNLFSALEGILKEKYPAATIIQSRGTHQISDEMATRLAKEVDTFVYGVGD
jgi:hypothetical protein